MAYNLKQQPSNVAENNFENNISAELAKGQFLAVTANQLPEGSDQREITVQIMDLEQAEGGTSEANSGMYVKAESEKSIKVTLLDPSGKELDSNVSNY